jgi:hypothetical protein
LLAKSFTLRRRLKHDSMAKPTPSPGYDAFVRALIQFSGRAQTRPNDPLSPSNDPSGNHPSWTFTQALTQLIHEDDSVADYETPTLLDGSPVSHADPLAPLKPRDEQALVELFTHDKIEEIAEEVQSRLKRLYPEPCWEDEPFDFLRQYL